MLLPLHTGKLKKTKGEILLNILQLLLWPIRNIWVFLVNSVERVKMSLMEMHNRIRPQIRFLNTASKRVSIVIPNFNGQNYLGDCIDSLDRVDFPREDYEIIIVDNASTDNSRAFICSTYPNVIL